jgi:hypothetical protein
MPTFPYFLWYSWNPVDPEWYTSYHLRIFLSCGKGEICFWDFHMQHVSYAVQDYSSTSILFTHCTALWIEQCLVSLIKPGQFFLPNNFPHLALMPVTNYVCYTSETTALVIFGGTGWSSCNALQSIYRRRESHRKKMHVRSPALLEWNHAAITWCVYRCRGVQSLNAG